MLNLVEHRVHESLAFSDAKARSSVEQSIDELLDHYAQVWPLAERRSGDTAPSWWDDDEASAEALALASRIGSEGW